jgi:RNA-directed DNA polymerase
VVRNVRGGIKANRSAAAGTLIGPLNPRSRGWARYPRHAVSANGCQSVDHAILQALWRWAKRRHPNNGARGGKARDVRPLGGRNWVFTGTVRGPKGQPRAVQWCAAHRLPITRHPKMASQANPDAPPGEHVREARLGRKMIAPVKGRKAWLSLWKRHQGRWPHGHAGITMTTGWHLHHKVWRSHGGSDPVDKRVVLHPTCHSHLHQALGSTSRPRPVTRAFGTACAGYREADLSGSERRGRR